MATYSDVTYLCDVIHVGLHRRALWRNPNGRVLGRMHYKPTERQVDYKANMADVY